MSITKLKEIFLEAAEAAKVVPASMQNAAFDRAVSVLLGGQSARTVPAEKRSASKGGVQTSNQKRPSAKRRVGAQAAIRELSEGAFFKTSHSLKEVQDYLEAKRGLKFPQTALSGPLIKLLQEGVLDRDKNADGVYEYVIP